MLYLKVNVLKTLTDIHTKEIVIYVFFGKTTRLECFLEDAFILE